MKCPPIQILSIRARACSDWEALDRDARISKSLNCAQCGLSPYAYINSAINLTRVKALGNEIEQPTRVPAIDAA